MSRDYTTSSMSFCQQKYACFRPFGSAVLSLKLMVFCQKEEKNWTTLGLSAPLLEVGILIITRNMPRDLCRDTSCNLKDLVLCQAELCMRYPVEICRYRCVFSFRPPCWKDGVQANRKLCSAGGANLRTGRDSTFPAACHCSTAASQLLSKTARSSASTVSSFG